MSAKNVFLKQYKKKTNYCLNTSFKFMVFYVKSGVQWVFSYSSTSRVNGNIDHKNRSKQTDKKTCLENCKNNIHENTHNCYLSSVLTVVLNNCQIYLSFSCISNVFTSFQSLVCRFGH